MDKEIKLHESWNEKWPQTTSSGTYLEGHMCRREGANTFQKKAIEMLEKYADKEISVNYVISLLKQIPYETTIL